MKFHATAHTVLLSLFLSTLGVSAFTFTFPLLAADKAIAGIWLGSAFSGYFLAKLILAPLVGNLADRIGARPLLLTATVLGTVIPWLYLISPSALSLYLVQLGLGIAGGAIKPLGMAVIGTEANTQQHGVLFGSYNLLFNIALMMGPLIAGLLFLIGPATPLLVFLSGTQLVSTLLLFFFVPVTLTALPPDSPQDSVSRHLSEMLPLLIAVVGRTIGIAVLITFYPILLQESLISNRFTLALFFAIPTLFTCLTLPLTGLWSRPGNHPSATITGMLMSAAGLLLISSFPSLLSFMVGGALLGIGAGISAPAAMTLAVSLSHRKGRTTGWFQMGASIGFIIGPVIAGYIVQQSGSVTKAFWAAGLLGTIGCFPLAWQQWRHPQKTISPGPLIGSSVLAVFFILPLIFSPLQALEGEDSGNRFRYAEIAMGTIVRMTLMHTEEQHADKAAKEAVHLIHTLQQDLDHRYREGSVGRINEAAGREPVIITEQAAGLIQRALLFCQQTKGVFDISIGSITKTPGYFQDDPSQEQRELVDFRRILFEVDSRSVFLPRKGMALDLGGLAKGTIIDAAVAQLQKQGIQSGIVEAGGDFFCFGSKKWRCGIQHPRKNELLGIIEVQNKAVCGSGDYYQFVITDKGGERTRSHHILDISSGKSAQKSIGVTTVAATTELADALATTLMIMGPEEGQIFLNQYYPDASALWVLPELSIVSTPNFPPLLQVEQK